MDQQPLTPVQRELVSRNMGLAEKISHEYAAKSTFIDIDEVVAVAYQGLIKAAQKFDDTRGVPFGGFARKWIIGEILLWQRKVDVLQRSIRADYKKIVASGFRTFKLSDQDIRDLAARAGLTAERVRTVLRSVVESQNVVSTDQHDDESAAWRDEEHDVESHTVVSSIKSGTLHSILELDGVQQVVLAMHYFEGLELQTIASALQMPVPAVREIHQEAILTIHQEMVRQASGG